MVVCNGEDLYGTGGVRSAKLSVNNDRDRKENGFSGRSLILIVVLSAIVPSLQDIGSNAHPDLPICGHVSPFLRRLLFWEGRRGRWAECRQEFARNLRGVGWA